MQDGAWNPDKGLLRSIPTVPVNQWLHEASTCRKIVSERKTKNIDWTRKGNGAHRSSLAFEPDMIELMGW